MKVWGRGRVLGFVFIVVIGFWVLAKQSLRESFFWFNGNDAALVILLEKYPPSERDTRWYYRYITAQQALLDSSQFETMVKQWEREGDAALTGLIDFFMEQQKWEKAFIYFKKLSPHEQKQRSSTEKLLKRILSAREMISKGNRCYNRGMLDSAEHYYTRAYEKLYSTPAEYLTFKARYNMLIAREDAGKLDRVKTAYQQLLEDLKGKGYTVLEINVLNNLGILFKEEGDFETARQLYIQASQIARHTNDIDAQAMLWINLGNLSVETGKYAKAITEFQKALQLAQNISDSSKIAEVFWNVSNVFFNNGQFDKALFYIRKALRIDIARRDTIGMCYDYFGLGKVFWRMGLWSDALKYLDHSLKLQDQINYVNLKASTLGQIAMIYDEIGLDNQAEALLYQSLEIAQHNQSSLDKIQTLHQLIQLYQKNALYDRAHSLLEQYQRLVHKTDFFPGRVNYLLLKGQLAAARLRPDSARWYWMRLLHEVEEGIMPEKRIKAILLLANQALKNGDGQEALRLGHQALIQVQAQGTPLMRFEVYNFLSELYQQQNNLRELKLVFQDGLILMINYAYYATISPAPDSLLHQMRLFYKKYVYFWYRQGAIKQAIQAYLNYVAVLYTVVNNNKILDKKGWEAIWSLNQQIEALRRLLQNRNISDRGRRALNRKIHYLQKKLEEKWSLVQLRLRSEASNVRPFQEAFSLRLEPGQAVVIPLIYPDTLLYLIKTPAQVAAIPIAVKASDLGQRMEFWKALMEADLRELEQRLQKSHLQEFYRMLIAPVDVWLRKHGVKQLYIALEDGMRFLPWNIAFDGQRYLAEIYQIAYAFPVLNTAEMPTESNGPRPETFLAMAPFPEELPFSGGEVQQAVHHFNYQKAVFLKTKATERAFKQNAPQARIVHLATHGEFSSYHPIFSYLKFQPDDQNDGFMYLYELEPLKLQAELVNLSVCRLVEASDVPIDGTVALQTNFAVQFLLKGAHHVLISLQVLPDRFAADFNAQFYTQFRKSDVGRAIQSVQTYFIKKGISPALWGNYFWITVWKSSFPPDTVRHAGGGSQ